jgi:hypothetical protein
MIKGSARAQGRAYASAALKGGGVAGNSTDLSALESGLQWKDDEVVPGDPPSKKAFSFRDFFVKAIGGG